MNMSSSFEKNPEVDFHKPQDGPRHEERISKFFSVFL